MGQQQLMLIVLGVIIVGIAIVVGAVPAFVNGMESSNKDSVTQDVLKLASAAQGYYAKAHMLGGGGNSFDNVKVSDVGMYANLDGQGENENGTFTITGSGNTATITGYTKYLRGDGSTKMTVTVVVYPSGIDAPLYDGW